MRNQSPVLNEVEEDEAINKLLVEMEAIIQGDDYRHADVHTTQMAAREDIGNLDDLLECCEDQPPAPVTNLVAPAADTRKPVTSKGPSLVEMAKKAIAEQEAKNAAEAASHAENVIQFPAPAPAVHPVAAVTTPSTEPVSQSLPAYSFPTVQDDGSTQASLRDEIESLVYGMKTSADYMTIRERYCAVSVMLNQRGQWAPAFRPDVAVPYKKAERLPVHMLVLRDRIVLDCHWLHSRGERVSSRESNWRNLIKLTAPFSFEVAADFAQRSITVEARAEEILGLTIVQQAQLRGLRGQAMQDRISAIDKSRKVDRKRVPSHMEMAEIAINTWCGRDRRIVSQREKYLAVARAEALLQGIGLATWAQRAALAALIEGTPPLSVTTYRDLVAKIIKKIRPSD